MLKKLLPLYKNSKLLKNKPENPSHDYYYFFDETEKEWIGIPTSGIDDKEVNLLKTLYRYLENQNPIMLSREAAGWHEFIFHNGLPPAVPSGSLFRFVQFSITDDRIDQFEIESALKGFFTEDAVIIWENNGIGAVIEEKKNAVLSEKELISLSDTLESDFYIKASFYIGKFYSLSNELPQKIKQEQEYFSFGIKQLKPENIFTFERVFPAYTAFKLPSDIIQRLTNEITEIFEEDPEMYSTIKIFLENNLNASVTAKKLYIHRNTLQYRIDKFVEKTGIGLKDFYGAFTVFLACLLFELESKH
jgi:hypothetical protein